MNTDFIQPFITATRETFKQLVPTEAVSGNPRPLDQQKDFLDVSAIIGLAGEVRGEVILSFEMESCLNICSQFTGLDLKTIDEDVIDAIGELVNVLAGNAKEGLMQYKIYISIPIVIRGKTNLKLAKNSPAITVPFITDLGNFNLSVTMIESN